MTRTLTAAVKTEIANAVTTVVWLVRLDFTSGVVLRWTGPGNASFDAETYTHADLWDISGVAETTALIARGVTVVLDGNNSSLLTTVRDEDYQGRDAKIYLGFLDGADALIADPVLVFEGRMDTAEIIDEGEKIAINLKIESRLADLGRPPERFYTDRDQRGMFPDDAGFEFAASLAQKDLRWAPHAGPTRKIPWAWMKPLHRGGEMTIREAVGARRIVFGTAKVGGNIVFAEISGDIDGRSAQLHLVIALCDGKVDSITKVYADDVDLNLDADGLAQNTSLTATTISVDSSDDSFNDSAAGFPAALKKNHWIKVSGAATTRDNGTFRVRADGTASKIKVTSQALFGLATEAAGASIKIEYLGGYGGLVKVNKHLGAPGQGADDDLVAAVDAWTEKHRLAGVAYLYVRCDMDEDEVHFANGLPNFTAEVQGLKVYDERTNTVVTSANAALILGAYLGTGTGKISGNDTVWGLNDQNFDDYGLFTEAVSETIDHGLFTDGVTASEDYGLFTEPTHNIAVAALDTAADVADENVTLAAGGTEKRYTINGIVEASETPLTVIRRMVEAMSGAIIWSGGKWVMRAGKYTAPVVALGDGETYRHRAIKVPLRRPRRELVNAMRGSYVEPLNLYEPDEYPDVVLPLRVDEDGAERMWGNLDLPFTTSAATAQRLARAFIERNHQHVQCQMLASVKALELRGGATVKISNARMGWTDKVFEVEDMGIEYHGRVRGPSHHIRLALRDLASTVWDWTAADDETQVTAAPKVVLPSLSFIGRLIRYKVGRKDATGEWEKQQASKIKTLTDGATINWDLDEGQVAEVTLGGNRTLANPTAGVNGNQYVLYVRQDATGDRTLAYGSDYLFPGGGTTFTLASAANAVTALVFMRLAGVMHGSGRGY